MAETIMKDVERQSKMNYIFFDLELNDIHFARKGKTNVSRGMGQLLKICPNEIMEIGAVKTTENLEYIDTFKMFVHPYLFCYIDPIVERLTGIREEDLNTGLEFTLAIQRFKKWIGEDYCLFAWGPDDEKVFQKNLMLHDLDTSWVKRCVDVQKYYMKAIDLNGNNQMSLKKAIEAFGIETERETHRALNDAFYTYKVYQHICDHFNTDLINKVLNKEATMNLEITEEPFDISIQCPKCGRFTKNMIAPFYRSKKYGSVGYCESCNLYYHKYKKGFFTRDGEIRYTFELKNITNKQFVNWYEKYHK